MAKKTKSKAQLTNELKIKVEYTRDTPKCANCTHLIEETSWCGLNDFKVSAKNCCKKYKRLS